MANNLIYTPTLNMPRDEWFRFRHNNGVGGSETAIVMGLSQYKSTIELFYEKLGDGYEVPENIYTFMGKEKEDFIAELWSYYEKDEETMIANYRANKIVRRCQRVNSYIQNTRYPHLFVSLDRMINKHDGKGNGCLEIKTVSGWELNKWQASFPPHYVVQLQTQLLVTEYSYGESCVLKDGIHLEITPFEAHKGIQKSILAATKDFWDRVLKARVIMTRKFEAQRTFNYKLVQECDEEIASLEPPPDNSEAYANFMKKKYRIGTPGEIFGSDEQLKIAQEHKKISTKIKELEEKKRLQENKLKNFLKDGADSITFGELGVVSWRNDEKGTRRFSNRLK